MFHSEPDHHHQQQQQQQQHGQVREAWGSGTGAVGDFGGGDYGIGLAEDPYVHTDGGLSGGGSGRSNNQLHVPTVGRLPGGRTLSPSNNLSGDARMGGGGGQQLTSGMGRTPPGPGSYYVDDFYRQHSGDAPSTAVWLTPPGSAAVGGSRGSAAKSARPKSSGYGQASARR